MADAFIVDSDDTNTLQSDQQLLDQYLEVCNRAIELNRDVFPYKEIFSAILKEKRPTVSVSLINDCPEEKFLISVAPDDMSCHLACSGCAVADKECSRLCDDDRWKVRKSYILEVLEDPETYINNPALIDWEWMMGRGPISDA